jgi:uncharacterized protein (TIGR02246 family)
MKMRLLFALAALAIGLAVRAFAQVETIMPDFSGNLAGDVKALDEFNALRMKEHEAFNKKDAAALAALFTEDAIYAAPEGVFHGRQAIEKAFVDVFQRWRPTNFISEGNKLNGIGNDAWTMVVHSRKPERSRASQGLLVRDLCSRGQCLADAHVDLLQQDAAAGRAC